MGEHPVARQKQEALACFLASDPTTVDIPTTEKIIASPAGKGASTLNKSFLAAVVASVARPDDMYDIGKGWEGDHHGGPLLGQLAGRGASGLVLGIEGMASEANHGLQGGGREFHGGYAVGVYYDGYLLALRHGSPEVRKLAVRALAANLAIDYLLTVPGTGEVIEIGGRATGGKNDYAAIIQRLWAHKEARVPSTDAAIACQMFGQLTWEERGMLPGFPTGVEDAVEILGGAGVVCPARFEWWGWESGSWRGQVDPKDGRAWFIDKRTGERALMVVASGHSFMNYPDKFLDERPNDNYDWHLTLREDGLQVHRRPGGEWKPTPPPDPAPHYLDTGDELARQLVEWGDEHGFQPARRQGREIRRAIHAEVKRLREDGTR